MLMLCYYLMMYGFSFCLVYADGPFRIFEHFRNFCNKHLPSNLADVYECMFCTPFQLGILFSILNIFIFNYNFTTPSYYINNCINYWYCDILFDGVVTASGVYLINTFQEFLEHFNNKDDENNY